MARSALMEVMTRAVLKAAKGIRRDFGELEQLQVSKKGTQDFVSAADLNAEKLLFRELQHARPKFGFLMEEGGEVKGEDPQYRWIIDPIDGTNNFLHAIPHFCISVALERTTPSSGTEIVAGVIYDPIKDEMFTVEKASGAFLNEKRIRVSARREVVDCMLSTISPRAGREDYQRSLQMMQAVTATSTSLRCSGSAALDLAYVAAGRLDGFWATTLKPWDMAAGLLLVKEAAGQVSEIGGGARMLHNGSIVATNGQIHKKVDALLAEFA